MKSVPYVDLNDLGAKVDSGKMGDTALGSTMLVIKLGYFIVFIGLCCHTCIYHKLCKCSILVL